MNLNTVIIKPIISEKSLVQAEKGVYSFKVVTPATKKDIKNAVEKLFGVNVIDVATNIIKGHNVRFTKLGRIDQNLTYKKARIKVANGQKISVFEENTK